MPDFSPRTQSLASLGGAKWAFYFKAKQRMAAGEDIISLTIGEPEVPPQPELAAALKASLDSGRVGYTNGTGVEAYREVLARRYAKRTGRDISMGQVLVTEGTQNALFVAMQTVAGPGDEVLVTDPLYATYEGVVRASGATPAYVDLRPEMKFHLQAADLAAKVTPKTKAILLNSPQNPTGAVLSAEEIAAIGAVAKAHDLWIISDEVYEELVFDGVTFASAFDQADLADRTIALSSLSKSHAAAGYRAGWLVSSLDFVKAATPIAETSVFGSPPFIQDAAAAVVGLGPSQVAKTMRTNYARRARRMAEALEGRGELKVHVPEAGMFVLLDARGRGQTSDQFATQLLDEAGVAVMPGTSFGKALDGFVRVSLAVEDGVLERAIRQIASIL